MSIAEERYFAREAIEAHRFGASAALAEQAVHCLELVAELADSGLKFQFKGGNSLLLILQTPRRFSIDVDIATDETRESIEQCLDTIVKKHGVFMQWTHRKHKTKPWIPLASYHLYFRSHFVGPEEAFIMLDAQLRRSPYKTTMKAVACGEIYACDILAELPLPASIIGDKLLTLGPNTLGIPAGKGKEAQRLKHVFDVSTLVDTDPDLDDIRASFNACMKHENEIQEKDIGVAQVLDDTLEMCVCVSRSAVKPQACAETEPVLREHITGLEQFAGHLFVRKYTWQDLQRDTARAAACMTAVCTPSVTGLELGRALCEARHIMVGSVAPRHGLACTDEALFLWNRVSAWRGEDCK